MRDGDGGLVLVRRIGREHQQAPGLLALARGQFLLGGGLDGSRQGCVRLGAMEQRKQGRRCRGQNVVAERDLLQEAPDTIPCALAMTDGRGGPVPEAPLYLVGADTS